MLISSLKYTKSLFNQTSGINIALRNGVAMTSKVEMVSVVIPTLNEAGNILEAVTTIHERSAYPKEIIVVDGNSTDGTIEIVKDTDFCRLIIEPRRGYGLLLEQA